MRASCIFTPRHELRLARTKLGVAAHHRSDHNHFIARVPAKIFMMPFGDIIIPHINPFGFMNGAGSSIENSVYYLLPCATTATYTISLTSVTCNGTNGLQMWASLDNATCTTFNGQKQDGSTGDGCNNTGALHANVVDIVA